MSIQCLNCGYPITEPICASCVINEVDIWLSGQNIKKIASKNISNRLKSLSNDILSMDYVTVPSNNIWKVSMMKCIRCKQEMNLMCSYCVTKQCSQIVKPNLTNKDSIEQLNSLFNIDRYDYTHSIN